MMARIGLILQIVSIVVVFLVALACASGETATDGTGGISGITATGGTSGQTGGQIALNTGGSTSQPDQTAQQTGGTEEGPPPPVCGNNIKEEGEICDGYDLGGATCGDLAAGQEGELSCAADCLNYNVDLCYTPTTVAPEAGVSDGGPGY